MFRMMRVKHGKTAATDNITARPFYFSTLVYDPIDPKEFTDRLMILLIQLMEGLHGIMPLLVVLLRMPIIMHYG